MNILVTGGAGFIGSNFLNLMVPQYPQYCFINIDKLTYAANLLNLKDIAFMDNYFFKQVDIAIYEQLEAIFQEYDIDVVIHFAAESHVDRSIIGPNAFIETNILGTFNLLEACRKHWQGKTNTLFHHVSTDEVYGSLGKVGYFTEKTHYDPSSPYSASKASSDHLVRAYYRTYNLPVKITNCSNNYGPYQFPEKLIPLMITNAVEGKPLPVYGKGENIRDWLYVEDHCEAIWVVVQNGKVGETYNIGGNNEWKNIDIVHKICEALAELTNRDVNDFKALITFVKDRPGHDLRYAINTNKIMHKLGWKPRESFESGLRKTILWYLNNQDWVNSVKSGSFKSWTSINYEVRLKNISS